MALVHGLEATVKIGGTQYEGYMTSAEMAATREVGESRALGADSILRKLGLRSFDFNCAGDWDAVLDAAVYTAWDAETVVAVIFSPDGGTTTYTVDAVIPEYRISGAANGLEGWSVRMQSSGDAVRA